jgi:hypothetical protein
MLLFNYSCSDLVGCTQIKISKRHFRYPSRLNAMGVLTLAQTWANEYVSKNES